MKLVSYKCPNCNASIQVDDTKRSFFCTYCGSPVNIDLGENVFTYREINEAEIRRVEADENVKKSKLDYKIRKMEIAEQRRREIEEQRRKDIEDEKKYIVPVLIVLAIIIVAIVIAWN